MSGDRMKASVALAFGLAVAGGQAHAQIIDSFTGSWQVEASFNDGASIAPVCVLQQTDDRIAGTCKGHTSAPGIATGVVTDGVIRFTWYPKAKANGGKSGRIEFSGKFERDSDKLIKGSAIDGGGSHGDFIATKRRPNP